MKFTSSTAFLFSMVAMAMAASTISEIKCAGSRAVSSCSEDLNNPPSSLLEFNEDATDEDEYYGVLTTDNETCADLEVRFPGISGCNPNCEITACTDSE